ncbi:MAG: AAA family ATPase [Pseudomonadales bacterium]
MNQTEIGALFVGREEALRSLQSAFDSADAGRGALVALYGEPGIGKTRCAEAFAQLMEDQGALVLWGRCLEQPGAPPYWPWTQILREYTDASSADELRSRLGSNVPMLAALLPDLAQRLGRAPTGVLASDHPEQRIRLFDAISRTLTRAAAELPVILIIDDLHWADASSLSLLEYLAGEVSRHRVLIVCAYRDVEVTRKSPLLATLGELTRVRRLERVRLTGLNPSETGSLTRAFVGETIPESVVKAIYQQTDGNPLFVREVARVVAEQLCHAAGEVISVDVPDGVREAIGRRLDRLSGACNELLGLASVIGRDFDLPLAAQALGVPLDAALRAADEAQSGGILELRNDAGPTQHRFSHALVRETLYEEIPTLDRLRTHQRIATAMQALHPGDEAVLSELVHHACEAAPLGNHNEAVDLARAAAARDERLLALEEASRHLELALRTLRAHGRHDDPRIALIWSEKARVDFSAGQVHAALEAAIQAADACRGRDPILFSRNVQIMVRVNSNAAQDNAAALLEEALAGLPDTATEHRSALLAHLALARRGTARQLIDEAGAEAVALARDLDDPVVLMSALRLWAMGLRGDPTTLADRLDLGSQGLALLERCRDAEAVAGCLYSHLLNLLEAGALQELAPLLDRYAAHADALHLGRHRYQAGLMAIALKLLRGEWAGLETHLEYSLEIGRRLDRHDPDGIYGAQMFQLNRELGRLTNLAPLIRHLAEDPEQRLWRPALMFMCIEAGLQEHARRALESLAADDFAVLPRDDLWLISLVFCAATCAALGDARRAPVLYRLLVPYSGQAAVHPGTVSYGAVDAYLGLLAATLGERDQAIRHLQAAIDLSRDMLAWPALARCQAELGELLRQEDPEQSLRLLQDAEQTAARLNMASLSARIAELLLGNGIRLPDGLTAREAEVVKLLAIGRSNKDISRALGISLSTVATHVRSILDKTGCANRTEAAAYAIRQQLN